MIDVIGHDLLRQSDEDIEDIAPGKSGREELLDVLLRHRTALAHQLQGELAQRLEAGLRQRARRAQRCHRLQLVLERRLLVLATVGSSGPFIGLFGTVWGIMNSFSAIAARHDTTLAVVAPGIAEALFATAIGLVAAIPAVVAYNKLSADLDRYANRVSNFADEFTVVLGRELESGRAPGFDSSRAA